MKLQSPCPVTLPLLQSFLSKANHSCPGDLSACLDFVEHTAVHDSLFEMDLSGEWSFYMGAMENASFSGETVTLPGTMDENGKGYDNRNCLSIRHLNRDYVYTGPTTYQRTFTLPSSWSNRRIVLELERTKKTRVLLDGVSVGPRQMSYSTPHRYDITPFCRAGAAHTLTIEVDNSASNMPHALYSTLLEGEAWSHQITEHTQTNWNGITGQLQLTALPGYAVSSMSVRPDVASHRASVRAVLSRPADGISEQLVLVKISANSLTGEHQTAPKWLAVYFPARESEICLSALHDMGEHPLLWDEFCPNLYRMTLSVYCIQDGVLRSAERCEDFGMRSFTVGEHDGGRQFFINGRPTILRGEINCAVFPRTGYPPTDLNTWIQLFQLYKDYGLNHVRFHTWIPPRSAFQAADRLGLYLYVELPQWGRRMFGDVYQGDMSDVRYYFPAGCTRRHGPRKARCFAFSHCYRNLL